MTHSSLDLGRRLRPARALSQYVLIHLALSSGAGRCAKDLEKVKMLLVSFERMFS